MPQAIDLTGVNNAAAVAKTFTLGSGANDGNVAYWELKEGLHKLGFPRLTASARPTGDQARKLIGKFSHPQVYTDSTTGLAKVGKVAYFNFDVKMPDEFPEAMKADFAAFCGNLLKNALMTSMVKDASSAT